MTVDPESSNELWFWGAGSLPAADLLVSLAIEGAGTW